MLTSRSTRESLFLLTPTPIVGSIVDFLGYLVLLGSHIVPREKKGTLVAKFPSGQTMGLEDKLLMVYQRRSWESFLPEPPGALPYDLCSLPMLEKLAEDGDLCEFTALDFLPIIYKLCVLQQHSVE